MPVVDTDILDPAHQDDGGIDHKGAAGIAKPAEPEYKASEDGNVVTRGELKYIREEALREAREENARLKGTLKQLEPVLPEFTEFLQNKANGNKAAADRGTREVKSDYSDDELDGYAIATGMYSGDGVTPDRARAEQALKVVDRIAQRRSGEAVGPLRQQSQSDRERANVAAARGKIYVDGKPIADQKYVDAVLESMPAGVMAEETMPNLANVIAAGLEYLDLRKQGRQPGRGREPRFSEGGTGRIDGSDNGQLSDLDLAAARARGKTPEQWSKLSSAVNKAVKGNNSRGDILEDI